MDQDERQDIVGETLAKFEFFENNWNPYNRFLDVDKVDIILRRRTPQALPEYREVQVRFGRLLDVVRPWEQALFDVSSSRSFNDGDLDNALPHLFVAYVLSRQATSGQGNNYKGDFFLFPMRRFREILRQAPLLADRRNVTISRSVDGERWFVRRARGEFDRLTPETVIDITEHRRAFHLLDVLTAGPDKATPR
jgi:hypothetical protein